MTLENILTVVGCLMTEMQVVVVSPDLQVLSAAVFSFVCMLLPLKWAGPLIVTLPSSLYAYLESPVPLVLGIERIPHDFKLQPGMLLVYPEKNEVVLDRTDMQEYHTLCLPQMSRLCHELKGSEKVLHKPKVLLSPRGAQQATLSHVRQSSPAWMVQPTKGQLQVR
jgi:hypothetical protein